MVSWGLITFLVGIAYGFLARGRQSKMRLLKTGLLIGILLALVLWAIGYFLDEDPIGFGTTPVGIFIAILIMTVIFVVGVWLGDILERLLRGRH